MKMGFGHTSQFLIFVVVVLATISSGNASTIVVGGSEKWHPGFNYTDWALQSSPFYINDKLVFKYDPPHNVYLLPNLYSFIRCDFKNAKLLAASENGGGNDGGLEVELNQWRVYYFASENGQDCKDGMMKFFVVPLPRYSN